MAALSNYFRREAVTKRHVFYAATSNLLSVLLFGVSCLLGLVLFGFNISRLKDRARLAADGVAVIGTVEWAGTSQQCSHSIHVRYRDANTHTWHRSFDVNCSRYMVEQRVVVVYLASNPEVAILGPQEAGFTKDHDVRGAWIGGLLTIFGAVFALRYYLRPSPALN